MGLTLVNDDDKYLRAFKLDSFQSVKGIIYVYIVITPEVLTEYLSQSSEGQYFKSSKDYQVNVQELARWLKTSNRGFIETLSHNENIMASVGENNI
ncbi:hypothetical protein [Listeria phage List-36]|uniref:Uncharacterized protein n=1 Tax=Listeria phage List-36 TaxID=1486422 RepID=A0A060ABU4_9CAUD|nr:hypothetical protein HH35_gp117 [Listeria phage List-36]YP_010843655.1 hypothetical protein PI27_gp088 [Listeria phage WIL-1]AIA64335.1 hypothetical protein [Listeria phage List-36]